jgi:hypothetical protein
VPAGREVGLGELVALVVQGGGEPVQVQGRRAVVLVPEQVGERDVVPGVAAGDAGGPAGEPDGLGVVAGVVPEFGRERGPERRVGVRPPDRPPGAGQPLVPLAEPAEVPEPLEQQPAVVRVEPEQRVEGGQAAAGSPSYDASDRRAVSVSRWPGAAAAIAS